MKWLLPTAKSPQIRNPEASYESYAYDREAHRPPNRKANNQAGRNTRGIGDISRHLLSPFKRVL